MQLNIVSLVATIAASVNALSASISHVVLEKRSGSSSWAPKANAKLDRRIRLPVKIGLKESNINLGDQLLMNIADPRSKDYGKHRTPEQASTPPTRHGQDA